MVRRPSRKPGPLLPVPERSDTGKLTKKIDAGFYLGKAARLYSCHKRHPPQLTVPLPRKLGDTPPARSVEHGPVDSNTESNSEIRSISSALTIGYSSRREGGENIDGPIEIWRPDITAHSILLGRRERVKP